MDAGLEMDAGIGRDAGTATDGGTNPDGGDIDPTGRCPEGSILHPYSLTPLANLPPLSAVELPALPPSFSVVSAGTGDQHSVRLDVCEAGDGTMGLKSLLWLGESFETPRLYVLDESVSAPVEEVVELNFGIVVQHRLPPDDFLVEGLVPALGGDIQDLEIRMVSDSGLLLLGQPGFVAFARGRVQPSSIEYTASTVVVAGGLAPGDVFADRRCKFGEQPHATTFEMGTASFEVDACTFLGGGFTTGYRINRLAVQDSSPDLTEQERQRIELSTEAEVEAVMNYVYNHHNACDSFHLALPHADYAASTAPAAGCGATVPNAPERDINEDPSSPVRYRIRYHGGEWTEGSIPGCTHYMFCN